MMFEPRSGRPAVFNADQRDQHRKAFGLHTQALTGFVPQAGISGH